MDKESILRINRNNRHRRNFGNLLHCHQPATGVRGRKRRHHLENRQGAHRAGTSAEGQERYQGNEEGSLLFEEHIGLQVEMRADARTGRVGEVFRGLFERVSGYMLYYVRAVYF